MLTPISNIHHHKLPPPGAIGYLVDVFRRERWTGKPLYWHGERQRYIVVSYPLTSSPDYRYSIGNHLVTVQSLRDGKTVTLSGIYFAEPEEL